MNDQKQKKLWCRGKSANLRLNLIEP